MLKHECKKLLAEKDRLDLYKFVRKEIWELKEDEELEEDITAEMVVENIFAKHQ